MEKYGRNIVVAIAVTLVGLVAVTQFTPTRGVQNRREIPELPGAVLYSEGQSALTEDYRKAISLVSNGNLREAEVIYRRIVKLEPGRANGYVGLASVRLELGDIDEAERYYRHAVEIDPASSMAYLGLGSVASTRRKYPEAIAFYNAVLDRTPKLPDAHWGLAIVYEEMKDDERAAANLREVLTLAPESNLARLARARLNEIESKSLERNKQP